MSISSPWFDRKFLVTGAPRSGTTVLGRIMAGSPAVNYLWEPFNNRYRANVPDYYPYIGASSPAAKRTAYNDLVQATLRLKQLDAYIAIRENDSLPVRMGKRLGLNRNFVHYRQVQLRQRLRRPTTLLCKDPIAVFLSQYLVEEHGFTVVGIVRHPVAVAESRRRLNWRFDFDWWRAQPDLYQEHVQAIDADLRDEDVTDGAVQAAYHWLTCYRFLHALKVRHPDRVLLVRHEDLCLLPTETTTECMNFVGLPAADKLLAQARVLTSGKQLEMSSHHMARLESRAAQELVFKWKQSVTPQDFATLTRVTEEFARTWYPEPEYWERTTGG